MIQKSTSSEVFDNFTKTMRRYNIKKQANWVTQVFETMGDASKPIMDVLKGLGKTSDEFIIEATRSGFTPEEIAKMFPGTSVDDVKKILAKSVPDAAGAATDLAQGAAAVADASKVSTELNNALTESYKTLVNNGNNILDISAKSKDLSGKNLDEIVEMYEALKRSRNSMKGTITKLKNDLAKAQEASAISAEELAKRNKAILESENVLKNSVDEVATLGSKITELGGKLDEAGNVIKGLEGELGAVKQELSLAQKTVAELSQQGIALAAENKRLLDSALEKSELAGYYKALHEALVKTGQGNTVAGKVAAATATQAQVQATQAVAAVTKATPAAAPAVTQAAATATSAGTAKAAKAINTPTPATPAVTPTPAAAAKGTSPAAATPAGTPPAAAGVATPAAKATATSAKASFLQNLALKNSPYLLGGAAAMAKGAAGLAGYGLLKVLKWVGIVGLVGGAAYLMWSAWRRKNSQEVNENINNTIQSEYDAITSLKILRFRKDTYGQQQTEDLINDLSASIPYISALNSDLSQEELEQTSKALDIMSNKIDTYIQNQEAISKDLENPEGFIQAIAALETLRSNSFALKQNLLSAVSEEEAVASKDESSIPERGITAPIGRPAPTDEEQGTPDHMPQVIELGGEKLDIGHLSPGLRSAAPRIIEKVIKSPEGLAFIDPDGVWGGWLPKTPTTNEQGQVVQKKESDYLRALKYLYLNKIFNRNDLRQFVRQNLPKAGRKRMSGWNNAVKYYIGKTKKYANQENNEFFTQKLSKPANNNTSSVIYDNRIVLNMKKKADQFSKEYFQDAVTGLEDQYAKSYYAGLKGMYDQKLSKTEADYRSLYEVHKESGNALIGSAHPETINVADAMANGGVVENAIEQQRHDKGVAQSMPSGNFRNRNAWVVQNLVKLADQVDEKGLKEASDLIDAVIKELTS